MVLLGLKVLAQSDYTELNRLAVLVLAENPGLVGRSIVTPAS